MWLWGVSSLFIIIQAYSRLTAAEFVLLRVTLLSVFQDTHKRVSILFISIFCFLPISMNQVSALLKMGVQNSNGQFVIPVGGPVPNGFEIPGTIRYIVYLAS